MERRERDFATAALAFVSDDGRVTVGPEAWFATQLDKAFAFPYTYGEIALGFHYRIADTVLVGLGGGVGLTQGVGTPDARGLFQLARTHLPNTLRPRRRRRRIPISMACWTWTISA